MAPRLLKALSRRALNRREKFQKKNKELSQHLEQCPPNDPLKQSNGSSTAPTDSSTVTSTSGVEPRISETTAKTEVPSPSSSPPSPSKKEQALQSNTQSRDPPATNTGSSSTSESHVVGRIAKAAHALDHAGDECFEQGNVDMAMTSYTRALKLKRRALHALEQQYREQPQAQDQREENENVVLASVATSMNNIGYLRQRSGGSSDEIMAAYLDALRIKKEILGAESLSVGKTLNNIGSVYFSKSDLEKAMDAYQEAFIIMKKTLGENHLDVATVHSNIGDVYLAQGDSEMALKKYRAALQIRWCQIGEHDRRVERLLEKVANLEIESDQKRMSESIFESEDFDEYCERDDLAQAPLPIALELLRSSVQSDLEDVENMARTVALDMVKEKLQVSREMKAISEGSDTITAASIVDVENVRPKEPDVSFHAARESTTIITEPTVAQPLTTADRNSALSSVKERLEKLRLRSSRRYDIENSLNGEDSDNDDQFQIGIRSLRNFSLEERTAAAHTGTSAAG